MDCGSSPLLTRKISLTSNWHIREFKGHEGLRQLKPDWIRLVDEMKQPGFEHDYEVHRAYFTHLCDARSDFRFLALTDGSSVRAICPVELTPHVIFRRMAQVWGLAPAHLYGISLDLICPADEAQQEFLPRVLQYLAEIPGGARWLAYDRVLKGSVLFECLMFLDQRTYCVRANGACTVVDSNKTFDVVAAGFSFNHKQSQKRARRRLEKLGHARIECAVIQPQLDQAFETFVELEASGWKGKNGSRSALRFHPDQLGPSSFRVELD